MKSFLELDGFFNCISQAPTVRPTIDDSENVPAFAPGELEIGSIVRARLHEVVPEYQKPLEQARPMLVTGLWRHGDDVKKLELMRLTTRFSKKEYPDDFYLRLDYSHGRNHDARLPTSCLYILDNKEKFFPKTSNPQINIIEKSAWPDILVRRANALLYNPHRHHIGSVDDRLTREGFVFPTIPNMAVRNAAVFAPEIGHPSWKTRPIKFLDQETVDQIAIFSASYEYMMRSQGKNFYSFPDFQNWPLDIFRVKFALWAQEREFKAPLSAPSA